MPLGWWWLSYEKRSELGLFNLSRDGFGAPDSSLSVPTGRLLKRQNQTLHRGTWWEDEGQWPHVEIKVVKIQYKE